MLRSLGRCSLIAQTGHFHRSIVPFLGLLLFAFVGAVPIASAQGVGFQGGFTVDPEQAYVGSHFESREITTGLHLRAGIDGGFSSGLTLASVSVDFLYKYPLGGAWKLYQGGGPSVHIARIGEPAETDVSGSISGIVGFAHDNGFFTEFKVGGGGGPTLKFTVGFTVH